ncbi:putative protein OS=Streptomyces aurantiogriseus OX=66870 GN=GCM10010251_79330 PE=4 SV=1 [Streptomyces aurantiogriseus]|uniref:Uncharacterized protein n=1 Tax=Streptomyces aurantiogriseus TaxID=66870 RepID=A0A918FMS1_9ACTN|nr:hypothetical protein GCM10010251_79330 [Streptomyces aurantiogriseus]
MKLGKALATGVAQERPLVTDDELDVPEELAEAETPEEVPAAR